ncbi:P-loop containing nucleoside triphosphate hydrolase protein [Rozella allomycis CSF55]|uniref:P-loop containing nucleoside triphosphate hydrolase protein n=1 Tax=Rozella allomycis (strain CSF55) TaxID=988480 RepID=A0A4P9YEM4_ROZAC|nr:P-loop containing nucleoside triphosphate hydrolase protein [Rozella allomycis CSF55]
MERKTIKKRKSELQSNESPPKKHNTHTYFKVKNKINDSHNNEILDLLYNLEESHDYNGEIQDVIVLPKEEAKYGKLNFQLPQSVTEVLERKGIKNLYEHQTLALNSFMNGENVLLCTMAAMINTLKEIPQTSIFVFPLNALVNDQCNSLREMLSLSPELKHKRVVVLNGSTPADQRIRLVNEADILLTNPEMIHWCLLLKAKYLEVFLSRLSLFVLDECHCYSGSFGVHTSMLLRRIHRYCKEVFDRDFQIIACSATIGEPKDFIESFSKVNFTVVESDTCAKEERVFIPYYGLSLFGGLKSLVSKLYDNDRRIIVFCKSRRMVGSITETLTQILPKDVVKSYRGGYTHETRREIELALKQMKIKIVVCTCALEMGVDIGMLDVVIHVGFPLSVSSFWQQAGRVGRRGQPSLSVLFTTMEDPLERHYVYNFESLILKKEIPSIKLNFEQLKILEFHLQRSLNELDGFHSIESIEKYFGPLAKEICENDFVRL